MVAEIVTSSVFTKTVHNFDQTTAKHFSDFSWWFEHSRMRFRKLISSFKETLQHSGLERQSSESFRHFNFFCFLKSLYLWFLLCLKWTLQCFNSSAHLLFSFRLRTNLTQCCLNFACWQLACLNSFHVRDTCNWSCVLVLLLEVIFVRLEDIEELNHSLNPSLQLCASKHST